MQEIRVRTSDARPAVGVVEVPDGWFVTVVDDGDRAMATPPASTYVGEGYQPSVLIRIEGPDVSDDLPGSVLVLSDRSDEHDGIHRRVRCTVAEMMGHTMMDLVCTLRDPEALVSVICSSTDDQWPRLAADFDRAVDTVRLLADAGQHSGESA